MKINNFSPVAGLMFGIATIGILINSASALNPFTLGAGEQIKFLKTFNGSSSLKASSNWETFSFGLNQELNINNGDIFLYWEGFFPTNPNVEGDKYFVGLRYNQNDPVCWNGSNIVNPVNSDGTCNSGFQKVQEDALVRMNVRPRDSRNGNNRFYELYQDPGFMIDEPEYIRLDNNSLDNKQTQLFRMQFSKVEGENILNVSSSYWKDSRWNDFNIRSASQNTQASLPLSLDLAKYPKLYTFDQVQVQFRREGSGVNAIAVTQISTEMEQSNPVSTPEPTAIMGLTFILGLTQLGNIKKATKDLLQKFFVLQ